MQRLVEQAGLSARVTVDSAGTTRYHVGELADPRTRDHARRRGIHLTHKARQITDADLAKFDLIVAMDHSHRTSASRMLGGSKEHVKKIVLLRSFDPTAEPDAEVPDPWYGGADGFEEVLDQCERACAGLLEHVRTKL